MSLIQRLRAALSEKYPGYGEALARVARAREAAGSAEAELVAAREALRAFGHGPEMLEQAELCVREALGKDA